MLLDGEHYVQAHLVHEPERPAQIRDGIPEAPRALLREYIDRGDLGVKSGRGFYDDYTT